MASGCFPLSLDDEENKKLIHARMLLREFKEEWSGAIYSGDSGGMQYDNAASDGGYLERIRIAIEMIDGCIFVPKPKT